MGISLTLNNNKATGTTKFKFDDTSVFDNLEMYDFNSYRNWGYFPGTIDPTWKANTKTKKSSGIEYEYPNFTATKSLFSNVNAIGVNTRYQENANALLIDSPVTRKRMKADDDCSVKALVDATERNEMGRKIYRYADFMYCKHLGKIPNNYLITLRRFPFPCGDHIDFYEPGGNGGNEKNFQQHMPDIGRMITWLGTPGNDMSNILKYSVSMPFKKVDAKMESGGDAGGDKGGLLGTLMNMGGNASYQQSVLSGHNGSSALNYANKITGVQFGAPQYEGFFFTDANKPYGPIDTIKSTHIRGEEGLQFENSFSLTFDYELRSYDGVNGKAAFLDLIANILATTYSTGKFWGGGYRMMGAGQHNAFANLPIYHLKNGASFSETLNAVTNSIGKVGKAMNGNKELTGNFLDDAKSIISNMGKQFAQALFAGALNSLGRPMKFALNSLLTPAPVGFWHVMIGNPKHPIVQMGNMILEKTEITQYGPLGLDDFPTGIKVVCTLKHAKMRDTSLFEQMFLEGDNRIYSPINDKVKEVYENSSRIMQKRMVERKWGSTKEDYQKQFAHVIERNRELGKAINNKGDNIPSESTIYIDYDDASTYESVNTSELKGEYTYVDTETQKTVKVGANDVDKIPKNVNVNPPLPITKLCSGIEAATMKSVYLKHFGTANMRNIVWAGMEGHQGSDIENKKGESDTSNPSKANK